MSWPRRPGCFPASRPTCDHAGAEVITVEAALAWAQQPQARPGGKVHAVRMTVARGFARHMAGIDPRTQIPPLGLLPYRTRWRPPFIYSDADITALMAEVPRVVRSPLRAATYQTLIGLLAATGMRVGEALRLERGQIDWAEGVLTVHATEFGKSRELPLDAEHGAGAGRLRPARDQQFPAAQRRRRSSCPRPGRRLAYPHFGATFRGIVQASGVGAGSAVRPRVHDVRHSFAVTPWPAGTGRAKMSAPCCRGCRPTWGTAIPRHTYWYLSAAPELLALAAARLEQPGGPAMTALAPTLQLFFTERLARQRQASPQHRCRLPEHLPAAAGLRPQRTGKPPSSLDWDDLDAETDLRVPGPPGSRPREQRPQPQRPAGRAALAVPLRGTAPPRARRAHPAGAGHPAKTLRPRAGLVPRPPPKPTRCSPPPTRPLGRPPRPRAARPGRADRPAAIRADRAHLQRRPAQRDRPRPLHRQRTQAAMRAAHPGHRRGPARLAPGTRRPPREPLFPTRTGRRLSDDAVERRVAIHTQHAAQRCPSLASKNVTPHTLRHTAAMALLHAGVDTAVIALWLGHADIRSTQIYLHADMTIKERALARTASPTSSPAATARPTSCSPSWKACDYPDPGRSPAATSPAATTAPARPLSNRDNPGIGINRLRALPPSLSAGRAAP